MKGWKRCKVCKKKAKYEEWSPDGPSDYFCSKDHHREYRDKSYDEGFVWRALPLDKIIT